MELAIPGAANGIFFNHGQCCNAGSGLYVERPVYDWLVDGVSHAAGRIKLGVSTDPDSQMGPLISDERFARVLGYLEAGRNAGASAAVGGNRQGERGHFVQPTVLTSPIRPCRSSARRSGRSSAPSRSTTPAKFCRWRTTRTTASPRASSPVWINTYHVFDAAMPVGGYKESGWGREMGHQVLENDARRTGERAACWADPSTAVAPSDPACITRSIPLRSLLTWQGTRPGLSLPGNQDPVATYAARCSNRFTPTVHWRSWPVAPDGKTRSRKEPRPLVVRVEPGGKEPVHAQLEQQLRGAIANGSLQPGDQPASMRDTAQRLGISSNSVCAGNGSVVASPGQLDRLDLRRRHKQQMRTLAEELVVRSLALGLATPSATLSGAHAEALLLARNRLPGVVTEIRGGETLAEVTLRRADGVNTVAVVTHQSLVRLGLHVGVQATLLVKATELTLSRVAGYIRGRRCSMELSARNQFKGKVSNIVTGGVMAEVTVDIGNGLEVVSVITKSSAERLGLQKGTEVTALIKSSEVLLAR